MTRGVYTGQPDDASDRFLAQIDQVAARLGEMVPANGGFQRRYGVEQALAGGPLAEVAL